MVTLIISKLMKHLRTRKCCICKQVDGTIFQATCWGNFRIDWGDPGKRYRRYLHKECIESGTSDKCKKIRKALRHSDDINGNGRLNIVKYSESDGKELTIWSPATYDPPFSLK